MNEKNPAIQNPPVYYTNGFGVAVSERDIAIALFDAEPDFIQKSQKLQQIHHATLKMSRETATELVFQLLESFAKDPQMEKRLSEILKKASLFKKIKDRQES